MSVRESRVPPPNVPPISKVLPAEPYLLMGAGPVPIPDEVARAAGLVINHLGAPMNAVLTNVKALTRYAFQTTDEHIFGVGGPASAAMEMAIGNLVWPGRRVLALKNGSFSGRLAEMASGVGGEVEILEAPLAQPVTPEMLAARLEQGRFDVVTMVQGEASCGVLTPALPELVRLAREHGALTVVDAVCTLSTMPFEKDAWGIDVAFTGSQKGLSAPPGVSMICFSDKAWQVAAGRKGPKPHWCYDVVRAQRFWGEHDYHYTAPVSGLLALHEALRLVSEETLERRHERHRASSEALQAGVEALGLSLMAPKEWRLNSVLAINVPEGVDATRARQHMCMRHKVEISGAFGLDIVRIGQMGEQCRATNLSRTLHALGAAFEREGARLDRRAGLEALDERCQVLS